MPGTFPAAGFQLLVFPQESKLPKTGAEFLVPLHIFTSVFKFIIAVIEGQWFDSSEALLVPGFLWELMRFWEQLQPWDETPRAA